MNAVTYEPTVNASDVLAVTINIIFQLHADRYSVHQVTESRIVADPRTSESRGFGFVGYATEQVRVDSAS